ncbi:MAG: sodium-dependent transporter [Ruminococcaceae bacterium]|nr:sodium-dependent transporter [Oscillospiraceae bacterium]
MNQREKFGSRLGFILISAGCAIGLGNVYRFPNITAAYGGAFFVLIYLVFLLLLGIPVLCAELSVGRASQRSIASSFEVLEGKGQKWHLMKYLGIGGNYLIMMCYTSVAGLMLIYFVKYLTGSISSASTPAELKELFGATVGNVYSPLLAMIVTVVLCFLVCSLGLQKGVERITKVMMIALLLLIVGLGVYCCTLDGTADGLKFYLIPSPENIEKVGIWTTVSAAMGQAFFTLSLGIGSIAVFGSYIGKDRSLLGEAVTIVGLDTFVALCSGFIIFPACFTFGGGVNVNPETLDASFLFTTLSSIFNAMPGGRIVGALFFLFMLFAAYSTVIAVFENIMSFWLEKTSLNRKSIAVINIALVIVLSLPAVLSFNILSDFKILGMDMQTLEDKISANILLPFGSLLYMVFCTSRYGWGWDNFLCEVNTGKGAKLPRMLRVYMSYVLPLIIAFILLMPLF